MAGIIDAIFGQTGTTAKTTTDIITEFSVAIAQKTVNECVTTATQEQVVGANWVRGDVVISDVLMRQNVSIDSSCVFSAEKQAKIQTDVANKIAQFAAAQGQAVLSLFGKTQSEAATNIRSAFKNSYSQSEIQRSVALTSQKQGFDFGVVGGSFIMNNVTMEQSARIVAEGIMTSSSYAEVINKVGTAIDQETKAEEKNPLNFIKDIFQGMSTTTAIIVGAIALVIIIMISMPAIIIFAIKSKDTMGGEMPGAEISEKIAEFYE